REHHGYQEHREYGAFVFELGREQKRQVEAEQELDRHRHEHEDVCRAQRVAELRARQHVEDERVVAPTHEPIVALAELGVGEPEHDVVDERKQIQKHQETERRFYEPELQEGIFFFHFATGASLKMRLCSVAI